ncbi:energy transducer TonB [Flavobacterium sp. H122]|uniref:energy transducer TonB n=1 Tax=Flavobacterium sp. H122 TaxID=2529860 RepID=UPI0010A9CB8C|nr:energy transducer TonB [Flavobacterium sp. H122]
MKKSALFLLSFMIINLSFAKKLNSEVLIIIPYEQVEVKPMFPGGINEFMKFVMNNFHLSEEDELPTGTVHVSMIIDKNGNVGNVQILRDLGNAGKEVKRVLAKCPKWQPGRMKGVNVDVEYNFPITIK